MIRFVAVRVALLIVSLACSGYKAPGDDPSYEITRYDIEINPNFRSRSISLSVAIEISNPALLNSFEFGLSDRYGSVSVTADSSATITARADNWITVKLSHPTAAVTLHFSLRGDPGRSMDENRPVITDSSLFLLWSDRFYPIDFEKWAPVRTTILLPRGFQAIAPGNLIRTQRRGDNVVRVFETSQPAISFSVFADSRWLRTERVVNGISMQTLLYPGSQRFSEQIFSSSAEVLGFYSRTMCPYPFDRFSFVTIDSIYARRAFPGFVGYSPRYLEKEFTGTGYDAHETALLWWGYTARGNGPGSFQWTEGFGDYLEVMYARAFGKPVPGNLQKFRDDYLSTPPDQDLLYGDLRGNTPQKLIHGKYPWLMHQIRNAVGDSAFANGIRLVFARFRHSTFSMEQFISTLEEGTGQSLRWWREEALERKGAMLRTVKTADTRQGMPDYSDFIGKYRAHIEKVMKENAIAGMSIAVVDRDSVVWAEGFGYYNKAANHPVTPETPFFIGSICKTFTATALMQLQEKGMVNLDEPLKRYIPAFNPRTLSGSINEVTVRRVLTHHAGIPDFIKDKFSVNPPYFTKVLDIVNDDYLTFRPNTIFSYSNAGLSLIGNLIESASGERYSAYIQKHLLEPMGMSQSGILAPGATPESVLLGYNSKGEELKELFLLDAPAGCIYSSANDMTKYIRMILGNGSLNGKRVIDPATLAEMMRIQNGDVFLDFGAPVGLTWQIYYNAAGKSIEHAGGSLAHRAELCIAPESGLGIIMMSNSANGGRAMYAENYDMFTDLMKLRSGSPPSTPRRNPGNSRHPEHNFSYRGAEAPGIVDRSESDLVKHAGTYGSFGIFFPVVFRNGRLLGKIYGQDVLFLPVENDEFAPSLRTDTIAADPKRRYYFEEAGGSTLLIQVDQWGNHSILGEKIDLRRPAETWLGRTGSYDSDASGEYQMFSNLRLAYEDSVLHLKIDMHIDQLGPPSLVAPLKVVNDSLAVVYGYGRFSGQAVQFRKTGAGTEVMKFMGYTCVKK